MRSTVRWTPLAAALLAPSVLAITQPAQAAGIANAYELARIGLTGSDFTHATSGYQASEFRALNAAGQAAGVSARFVGNSYVGSTAWLYSGGSTQAIGLSGAGYSDPVNGYQSSDITALNQAGQVLGRSDRYIAGVASGQATWLYSGGASQSIGLTGAGYTDTSTGYALSYGQVLNDAGQVAGFSARFNGATATGYGAWLYSGGSTQAIGPSGAGYTNATTGTQKSAIKALNNAGQVVGGSERFIGSNSAGQTVWLFSGGSTQVLGFGGAGFTNTGTGYQHSDAKGLNASGQVAGFSTRFDGSTSVGDAAWLYTGGATQEIGLSGAGYTRSSTGQSSSVAVALNDAGQVVGSSVRYSGDAVTGGSAWLYSGGVAKAIGLTGSDYTGSSGFYSSNVSAINAAGQVAGWNARYVGGSSYVGDSAWVYDDDLDQTFDLTFSVSSDGSANSTIHYLGDDGLVLGSFEKFSGSSSLGQYAFAWTEQDGMVELGSVVNGGLGADWIRLGVAYQANGAGQIGGEGPLAGGGLGTFLMTPVPTPVPEPQSPALLLAGLGALRLWGRRQRRVA